MKKKCLLLGGAGFIGKNLALFLKNQGYTLTIYDHSVIKKFSKEELEGMKIVEKNFFTDANLEESLKGNDVIIHLISSVNPAKSMVEPSKCYSNDLIKTIEMLEIARVNRVSRVIFISSGGTIYGNYDEEEYSEDMPTNPINHYGIMKLAIEKVVLMYNQLYNMDNVILRISNPYGKGQDPNKNLGAISVFTGKVLNGHNIQIYGDGETVRDYVYIDDVVKTIERAINYTVKKGIDPIFNVGSGVGTTLNQLINLISTILDKKCDVEYVQSRGIDVRRSVLNIEKSMKELEITPEYNIRMGIECYIKEVLDL